MDKKIKLILIIGSILILLVAGVLVWYFFIKDTINNNETNENKNNNDNIETSENNNNNDDNEIVNPNKDEDDTRVYPLKMKFYKDKYGVCYETVDGNCVRVYYNNEGYQEEIWNDLDEENLLAEYTCNSFDCVEKNIDYDENLAFILDEKIYIYDFISKKAKDTNLTNIMNKEKIEYIYLANNFGNDNYDLIVYSLDDKGNIYNTKDKKFLFDKWYDNALIERISVLDDYYLVRNEEQNEWYIINREDKILKSFTGKSYYGKTYDNKIIMTYDDAYEKYSFVLYKDDLDKRVDLQGDVDIQIVDNYLFSSDSSGYPDHQKVHIYDKDTLKLIKTIDNALHLSQVKFANETFYVATVDIGRGGNNTATQVLDSNFNILIGENNLPSDYEVYDEGYFTPYFNDSNNTIATWFGKIYVYNLNGNLVKTIDRDIIGLAENYYVANENNDITLRDYDDNLITTFTTINDNLDVDNKGLDGYLANIGYNEDQNSFNVVIKDKTNYTCKMYSYSFVNQKTTEINSSCGWD